MKLEMSLKKNVVGDLKFWKYFRTRFAGTHPPRLLVSPDSHWLQRHKILVILMGHQKIPKFVLCSSTIIPEVGQRGGGC
jgi:hypothetical protein